MKHELLELALEIAIKAHKGQVDKSGAVYIFHPIRVAERCSKEEEDCGTAPRHDRRHASNAGVPFVTRFSTYDYRCGNGSDSP